ncbi:MAG: zinc dependent phospholipase C family protein [Clostridia bacterium]|nr:zinc dependent phospholipase C family protein [Clostridia bacterium]
MPALYAHLRFGEEVLRYLPSPLPALIRQYPEAYAIGTQGPDVLFYHQPMKKNELRAKGTHLHTLSGHDFFLDQAQKLAENAETNDVREIFKENGAYAAYVCGFLCHFTLDVVCHPFIDRNSCEEFTHGKIESEFDKFMLRKTRRPIRGYNAATPIILKNGAIEAVAYALDIPEENVKRAMKTMRKINKLFSYPAEWVHNVCHAVLGIVGMERKFGDMFLHRDDDELSVRSNEILWDKYSVALPMAAGLIREFFLNLHTFADGTPLHSPLMNYDFSGILKIQRQETEYNSPLEYQTAYFSARPMPAPSESGTFAPPSGIPFGSPNGMGLPSTPPPMPHPSITPTPHPSHTDAQTQYQKPTPTPHPSIMQEQNGEPNPKKKNKR